jgi:hypothetical protein
MKTARDMWITTLLFLTILVAFTIFLKFGGNMD